MSEQLHEAAQRARQERRRRLVSEVAPYLAPGERVVETTSGRGVTPGQSEDAPLRIVVTDQRLLLLRKKAFRQFAVQAFGFERSRVSLGFTPQAGGELDVSDPVDRRRVSVTDIPELDLEPLFVSLRGRLDDDRLDVWTAPPWHAAEPAAPAGGESDIVDLGPAEESEADVIELREPEHVVATIGGSTIEEILVAAGFPPESLEGPVSGSPRRPAASSSAPAPATSPGPVGDAFGSASPDPEPTPPPASPVDVPVIIPEAEPEATVEGLGGAAQAGILRWLLASTGAGAVLYLERSSAGEENLQMEPRRLDARLAMSMVRTANDSLAGATHEPGAGEEERTLVTHWGEAGDERVLVLSGVPAGAPSDVIAFARFVLDRLGAPVGVADRSREDDRPRLVAVQVTLGEDERPAADVRLAWRGHELIGRGHGHTSILGRHLAAARGTADALRQVLRADLVVEHVLLSYPPMDAELVVATVLVGARRFVGATAADPGDEEAAAARAVLDALNRNLGEID
jgi:hypothetical protein